MFDNFKYSGDTISIEKAVLKSYNELGDTFHLYELYAIVYSKTTKLFYNDSARKSLDKLKRDGKINHKYIGNKKYIKL